MIFKEQTARKKRISYQLEKKINSAGIEHMALLWGNHANQKYEQKFEMYWWLMIIMLLWTRANCVFAFQNCANIT